MVAILLHKFVLSDQAVEYFATMAHMWEFGGRITRTCSPETKMAMFGHKFYYNDCVPASELLNLGRTVLIILTFSLERTF